MPGLTNVTDWVRCHGFYPWFVHAFDARYKKKGPEELIKVFRRAECLHTLIGIVHELDQGDEWLHGGGLVGRDATLPAAHRIVSGETVRLSRHSKLEPADDERYFKHSLGGLGQYYLGPFKDLEVMDGNAQQGIRYTAEWRRELAAVYGRRVDAKAFFDAVDGDRVDLPTVRALSPFPPCHLRKNKSERDALVRLLFRNGDGPLRQEIGDERRQTLTLLLDYARALRTTKCPAAPPGARVRLGLERIRGGRGQRRALGGHPNPAFNRHFKSRNELTAAETLTRATDFVSFARMRHVLEQTKQQQVFALGR